MIHAAAGGAEEDRDTFAGRYGPAVRAYLGERWKSSPFLDSLDDAVQEVFLECFKHGGVLDRHDQITRGSFRGFFYGVVRNVALRIESRAARRQESQPTTDIDLDAMEGADARLSQIFDQAWARSLLREAVERMGHEALKEGDAAKKRLHLLHLRFYEGLTLREAAVRLDLETQKVYREFDRALKVFKAILREVVSFHCPDSPTRADHEFNLLINMFQ